MNGPLPIKERFYSRINKTDGCWLWTAGLSDKGYGVLSVNNKSIGAHRISYEIHNGPIPKGMFVCHACDNPPCVNPEHLFLGTNSDNIKDALKKGLLKIPEKKPFCKRGHAMVPGNLYFRPKGYRACKACMIYRVKKAKRKALANFAKARDGNDGK